MAFVKKLIGYCGWNSLGYCIGFRWTAAVGYTKSEEVDFEFRGSCLTFPGLTTARKDHGASVDWPECTDWIMTTDV
jgi:hypothetical protein